MKYADQCPWNDWKIVEQIGGGSYGAVYEIQRNLHGNIEKAAMKVIHIPNNLSEIDELYCDDFDDESITARFKGYLAEISREYSLMSNLKGNRNIVYCDDYREIQQDNGIGWDIFIKMELLTPLNKALKKNIPEEQVIGIGIDMCNALVVCKDQNIVHRDIKPQNIFVSKDGTYKLGDFGIAKTVERTTSGTKTGTYKYMAPEVYQDRPYGAAADQYSLGMVLYWLLNERRGPFLPLPAEERYTTEPMENNARRRRFNGDQIPPPAHGSEALKSIVLKACEYDPKDRFPNAEEMLSALWALQNGSNMNSGNKDKPEPHPDPDNDNENPEKDPTRPEIDDHTSNPKEDETNNTMGPVTDKPSEDPTVSSQIIHGDTDDISGKSTDPESDEKTPPKNEQGQNDQSENSEDVTVGRRDPEKDPTTDSDEKPKRPITDEANPQTEKKKKGLIIAIVAGLAAVLGGAILLYSGGGSSNKDKKQVDWTQWADSLPDTVTEEEYNIEERTLYSISQMETTQSTQSDKMAGWELFNTVKADGGFGEWSDWSEEEQKSSDTREVETQTRYRYRDKETTTGNSDTMDGWTLENTTTTWGDYGAWSEWSQNAVSGSDSREVQTQTKYRYRDKETTTSSSASMAGWTQYDVTVTPGEWGGWSGWSSDSVSGSDNTQVETKTQYSYREKSYTTSSSSSMSGWTQYDSSIDYGPWSGWSETPVSASESLDVETKEETVTSGEETYTQIYYRSRSISRTYKFFSWGGWSDYSDNAVSESGDREVRTRTMYRYRTRGQSTSTYKFYRWTDWSAWTTSAVSQSSTREVQTQTSYRYRDRTGTPTYHFSRWSDWSEWSETEAEATDDRKVETATFYRFRDQVTETTYYFRRWTDWSEYSEKAAEESDTVKVRTKTEYRYRSKQSDDAAEAE